MIPAISEAESAWELNPCAWEEGDVEVDVCAHMDVPSCGCGLE